MSRRWLMSRRRLTRLLASLVAGLPFAAYAEDPVPSEPEGLEPPQPMPIDKRQRDRGIGGTGVIGTIRQFGSIVVNDLRIAYPPGVAVIIDGIAKSSAAMRIGHVVEVVAQGRREGLSTRRIVITSEVIGPVETVSATMITVLGQIVLVDGHLPQPPLHPGEVVAVSGLRRLDGTIVASLIERRRGARRQIVGLLQAGSDGAPRIGQLVVRGARSSFLGQRVLLTGRLVAGVFEVTGGRLALALLLDSDLDYVSMEAYGERRGGGVVFGSGLLIAEGSAAILPGTREVRLVAEIRRDDKGALGIGAARITDAGGREGRGLPGLREGGGLPALGGPGGLPLGSPPGTPGAPGTPGGLPGAPHL